MSDTLANARAAAAELLQQDTGEPRPRWRVVITDSESLTGIAPACNPGPDSDEHPTLDGGQHDEQGVYDCCPWPLIEAGSPAMAAYLVELLNADAAENTHLTSRQGWLLREIRSQGGRWKTGRARTAYSRGLIGSIGVDHVRRDLQALHKHGYLRQVDESGARYYELREEGDV